MNLGLGSRLVVTAAVAMLVASCGSTPAQPVGRTATPSPAVVSAGGTGPRAITLPPAPPAPIDPLLVSGLDTGAVFDETQPLYATWPVVPGAPVLNAGVVAAARELLATTRTKDVLERRVDWSFVALDAAMIGVRLQLTDRTASSVRYGYRTVWYDARAAQLRTAVELLRPAQVETVRAEVVAQLAARSGLPAAQVDPRVTRGSLRSVGFDRETGDVIAEFDAGFLPGSTTRLAVRLQAQHVEPLLSGVGAAALSAARKPRALSAEGGTASPTTAAPIAVGRAVNCAVTRCVALVFVGGPTRNTQAILDVLAQQSAPATFAPVGRQATLFGPILAGARQAGHQVANGTLDYSRLAGLPPAALTEQVHGGRDAIVASGAPSPTVLVPPFRAYDARVKRAAGTPLVFPNVDSQDWRNLNEAQITSVVTSRVVPGSIIRFHDSQLATTAALPGLITWLRDNGYTLVTVQQILAPRRPVSGGTYGIGARPPVSQHGE